MRRPILLAAYFFLTFLAQKEIYEFRVIGSGNSVIDFNEFRNKKILLVNIASESRYAYQLGELQQLKENFGNSVVIVAFPSNSFGHESRNDKQIRTFCRLEYGVDFLIAKKNEVTGIKQQPIYQWLTKSKENGIRDSEVKEDFQKYIIDSNGELLAVFAGSVSPNSSPILNTLKISYN